MRKRFSFLKGFAGVLLALSLTLGTCGPVTAPDLFASVQVNAAESEYVKGNKVSCAGYTGTITGTVKMDNTNFYEESGSLVFDSVNADGDVVFVTEDEDNNIRVRCYIEEGKGVKVSKGDVLVFKYEPSDEFPFGSIRIEGLVDDPEGWDSMHIGYLDYKEGFSMIPITEDFYDQNLVALRIKGDGAPEGSGVAFSEVFILKDVKAPEPEKFSYTVSEIVKGVSTTFYSDVYSRGVAWRTVDKEGADTGLQYVEKKYVDDIHTYDWKAGLKKGEVITVPDCFGSFAIVNSDESATYYCHKAHVENLPEGGEYYYRVGGKSVGYSRPGLWTIAGDPEDFFFIYVTDPQAENEAQYRQYESMMRAAFKNAKNVNSKLVAYIECGDITNECHDEKYFIDEYNMAVDFDADDMMDTVHIPIAGNHDNSPNGFYSMYDIDFADYCPDGKHNPHNSGGCSSVKIGNVYLISTNSNESGHIEYESRGEYDGQCDYREQYRWIVNQLETAKQMREQGEIKWIIVLTHAGMMSVGYHTMDGGSKCLRENLVPLFAKYSVDLILQGHDHAYTRTNPYYYGLDVNGDYYTGYVPNERETGAGYGTITYDDPFTEEIETEGRKFNIEPEGTHYVTMNYAGEKSLDISKENAESRYAVPDSYIEEGCATSVINEMLCGQRVKQQFYGFVRIKGDVLTLDTYAFNGKKSALFDTFTVKKDGSCKPDISKKSISFKGIYAFSKAYDGQPAELDVFDITAYNKSKKVEKLFKEYDDVTYYVTGITADGTNYKSTLMPVEPGKYTLHARVSRNSVFFKGETKIDFEITK